ncbi:Uncharacterised protein [Candidatus Bartonella washoeensis]|nr:hypothetical protein MCQ_01220 [Bartonella washoeensis Sb944nv]SPU27324.1 Uncharacterised protein [Bartonella washoeensis]
MLRKQLSWFIRFDPSDFYSHNFLRFHGVVFFLIYVSITKICQLMV